MAVSNETFKRGQVEWAIWRFFTLAGSTTPKPPKVFETRIKRLLETDRNQHLPADIDFEPDAPFAFATGESEGQGVDAAFSPFDAFCLALALDLLDVGFKQSEIVFLFRYIRPDLEREFQKILKFPPPSPRQREFSRHRPEMTSYKSGSMTLVDGRVFLVLQKIELTEIFPKLPTKKKRGDLPIFLEPKFCHGIDKLASELGEMNTARWGYRKALVLEIAYLAKTLSDLLAKAPLTKRGRK